MKRCILFLFMNLLLTQQTNFYHIKDMWEPYIKSKETQENFRSDINLLLKKTSIKSNPNPLGAIQLHLWYIRSLYSDGRIEEAIEYYKNKIVNGLSDSFTKNLFHHLYSSEIKNCSKNKCLCSGLSRDGSNIVENLDILNPKNLKKNFVNLWLVIGDQEQIHNSKNLRTYQFIHDESIIHHIEQPTLEVNLRYNVTNPKIQKNNVTFAILPRPYNAESCNSKPDVFKCELNQSAKERRIHHIRDKYWNDELDQIKEIMTVKEGSKQQKEYNLDEFNFKDVLEVDNQPILDKNNKNVYAKRVHPIDIDKKTTFNKRLNWDAILDTSNSYFPILEKSIYGNEMDFNRLYIFNGNKSDYARYSFVTYKKVIELNNADAIAKNISFGEDDEDDNQKLDNDCFVFIRWQEDNWYLSEYISDEQFNLVIPTEYLDKYDIQINNTPLSNIKNDQFFEGLKRVDISDNLPTYNEYFNKKEETFVKKNLGLNIENGKIKAIKIEAKPGDKKFNIGSDKLEVFIEPKQDVENNNNSNRMVWIPLIVGFSIMLLE